MRSWMLYGVLLAGIVMAGCPSGGGGDDDDAADDDDATDPVEFDHTVTVDGPDGACGTIESASYTFWTGDGPGDHTIRASTVADHCARYRDYWEAWAGGYYDYETYTFALVDQDGPEACANLRLFLSAFEAAHDAAAPAGSCTLEVYLPAYLGEGTWSTLAQEGGLRIGGGQVWIAGESRIGTILELLDDCSTVADWADWLALTDGQYVDRWRGLEAWTIEIGEMELAEQADGAWSLDAEGMVIEDPASGAQGTLDFQLLASPCELQAMPPGW
jgi:hypothetical protein